MTKKCIECDADAIGLFDGDPYCQKHASTRKIREEWSEIIHCPIDDCDAGPWPDTYGADGGRKQRVLHLLSEHDDVRGDPLNKIERL